MITESEVIHYWNYFRTLCTRLEKTRQYLDHDIDDEGNLKHGKVNSWEFQQILFLSAMEFENVCKQLCLHFDPDFSLAYADIRQITKRILNKYPNIGLTEITTDYQALRPLSHWKIKKDAPNSREYVSGLSWWDAYGNLKHQTFQKFELATLENAINSLSSLLVIEIYLMKEITGHLNPLLNKPCDYFNASYASSILCTGEKALPDFDGPDNKDLVQGNALSLRVL